jgi:hypothetical protein
MNLASPTRKDFTMPILQNLCWDSLYICPQEDGRFCYYVCGIKREYLMQYKLLAINSAMNLIRLSTATQAHLQLYKTIYGSAFRRTQLALDLQKSGGNLGYFFTPELLNNIMTFSRAHFDHQEELPFLATSMGLYLLDESANANKSPMS